MLNKLNHTQLSNDFIDNHMKNLSGNASKIFIAISRKTIGWHKDTDKISFSQLLDITGIKSRDTLNKAIKELEIYNIIKVSRVQKTNQYEINYFDESVQKLYQDSTETVPKIANIGTETEHTKETIKETKQKKECDLFDQWYEKYDKKKGRKDALKKWNKLSLENKKKCLLVVDNYVKSTPDKNYRKNPETYLNKEAWEDEITFNTNGEEPIVMNYLPKRF
jgi:phage replication O-like protein O